jgi:hypothetical protein
MSLRIRRGTDAHRTSNGGVTFDLGELVYTTDTKKLYVGDGVTAGGLNILEHSAGAGIKFDSATQTLELDPQHLGLTTSDISEGSNLYYLPSRALSTVGNALTAGNQYNNGITFALDTVNNRITATLATGLVQSDAHPALGGDLSLNSNSITGVGNINITGSVSASNTVNVGTHLSITGNRITSTQTAPSDPYLNSDFQLSVGSTSTPNTLYVTGANNFFIGTGITTGTVTAGYISRMSRGTLSSPTPLQPNDFVSYNQADAYDGTNYVPVGAFGMAVDPNTTVSSGAVAGLFGAMTLDKSGTQHFMTFDSTGLLNVPAFSVGDGSAVHPSIAFATDGSKDSGFFHPGDGIVCVAVNAQEGARFTQNGLKVNGFVQVAQVNGSLPGSPQAGMIVLDGTTFKGYNGSGWVNLN